MTDYATQLGTELQRIADSLVDEIAKDGLEALKRTLDQYGFADSPHLRNYDVLAHVDDGEILFEILVDVEALDVREADVREMLESARPAMVSNAARTYGMGMRGVERVSGNKSATRGSRDARQPPMDARRPTRNARKGSGDRLLEHEMASHAPRSLQVTREGKLSVMLRRSLREMDTGVHYPQGMYEGLLKTFMDKLVKVVQDKFVPALQDIVEAHAT